MGRILIVEDDPRNMELAAYILENAGHEVFRAVSAIDGIALAHQIHPDLILMDIQLPGMDGIAATQSIRDDPTTDSVPVVAVTGFAMQGDEQRIQNAGFQGYLAKPYGHKHLLSIVEKVLQP